MSDSQGHLQKTLTVKLGFPANLARNALAKSEGGISDIIKAVEREYIFHLPVEPESLTTETKNFLSTYKVEKCKELSFHDRKQCICWHSKADRRRNPLVHHYSSQKCNEYDEHNKFCKDGDACAFYHNNLERMYHPDFYKISICENVIKSGSCDHGKYCAFAHKATELRKPFRSFRNNYRNDTSDDHTTASATKSNNSGDGTDDDDNTPLETKSTVCKKTVMERALALITMHKVKESELAAQIAQEFDYEMTKDDFAAIDYALKWASKSKNNNTNNSNNNTNNNINTIINDFDKTKVTDSNNNSSSSSAAIDVPSRESTSDGIILGNPFSMNLNISDVILDSKNSHENLNITAVNDHSKNPFPPIFDKFLDNGSNSLLSSDSIFSLLNGNNGSEIDLNIGVVKGMKSDSDHHMHNHHNINSGDSKILSKSIDHIDHLLSQYSFNFDVISNANDNNLTSNGIGSLNMNNMINMSSFDTGLSHSKASNSAADQFLMSSNNNDNNLINNYFSDNYLLSSNTTAKNGGNTGSGSVSSSVSNNNVSNDEINAINNSYLLSEKNTNNNNNNINGKSNNASINNNSSNNSNNNLSSISYKNLCVKLQNDLTVKNNELSNSIQTIEMANETIEQLNDINGKLRENVTSLYALQKETAANLLKMKEEVSEKDNEIVNLKENVEILLQMFELLHSTSDKLPNNNSNNINNRIKELLRYQKENMRKRMKSEQIKSAKVDINKFAQIK